ncbi:hypothetical protein HYQ46_001578 [Verticillium longisporum]|nr:hypothetical protein HYQ46_001578 [Verticillium longisporum]
MTAWPSSVMTWRNLGKMSPWPSGTESAGVAAGCACDGWLVSDLSKWVEWPSSEPQAPLSKMGKGFELAWRAASACMLEMGPEEVCLRRFRVAWRSPVGDVTAEAAGWDTESERRGRGGASGRDAVY